MPNVELRLPDGVVPCYEVAPAGARRALLLYMDGPGLRDALRAIADRLGAAGYRVLVPDLYHRLGRGIHFDAGQVFSDPAKLAEMRKLIGQMTMDDVMQDSRAFLAHLGGGPIGVLGYCMGGRAAFSAAAAFPEAVRAAASIHPGGLVSAGPESPHLRAGQIRGRLYIAQARDDSYFTDEQAATLRDALDAASLRYQLEKIDARHGFAVGDTPTYDVAAAELHWQRVLALFDAEL
jgi:carboxymethylenebutenolidase